jgi:DNA-binding GntR family transcriptional regulator
MELRKKTSRRRSFNSHSSLRARIIEYLEEIILDGELKPGDRINEGLISQRLGVSRSPLREAIRVLESENLVETFERRGAFIKGITARDVDEVYLVLSRLEGTIASLATENLTAMTERKLKSLLRRFKRAVEQKHFTKSRLLFREFHHLIARASGNQLLIKIRLSMRVQEEIFHRAYKQDETVLTQAISEHQAIGEAIIERDAEKAKLLMDEHVRNARARALRGLLGDGVITQDKS